LLEPGNPNDLFWRRALELDKIIVPVIINDLSVDISSATPPALANISGLPIGVTKLWTEKSLQPLIDGLKQLLGRQEPLPGPDPEDPQCGRWGGKSVRNGRALSAAVASVSSDWFDIELTVKSVGPRKVEPLKGLVIFHLHPTFDEPKQAVEAIDGVATLELQAWGAFTVGALVDNGSTMLELNLAKVARAPKKFRER
jgi:hypothetical protein